MARVIAICNAKGGVGKTTTAVNLAAYLALMGKRALLIDFDPQGNASSALGYNPLHTEMSVYHGVLNHVEPQEIIKPSVLANLHLIPSAPHLAGMLVELVNEEEREYFLRKFLHKVRHYYDYILIDLPPSLSLLTVNGLVASDEVLIPVQAEYYSLEGLGQLLETVDLIRNNLGHDLKITGALITMYDKNQHFHRDVAQNVRAHFPHKVFEMEIPRSSPLAEAPSFSKPVLLHRPDSSGAQAYERLARDIVAQEAELFAGPSTQTSSPNFGDFNIAL